MDSHDANPHSPSESLAGAPAMSPSLESAATISASLREGPGTRIGPYKILQLIGEGGFGSVFMAEQEKPVARKVALKIIKLGMDTRQVIARFEAERQALAMMDHPNIARVLDAGATDAGRPFFVMELVKGEPIIEYCDRHHLNIHARLELFVQVCGAVQHAHTKGIIHRDIKPNNILVSMQDGQPSPKVIDFGIAKATSARLTDKTLFTEHRQFIGTPEYMSPEQADGSMDIDTRTDVYSLGVLLYELLTGTTPFDSVTLRSAAYAEMQRIIREVEPPIPSTRLFRSSDTIAAIAAKRQIEPRKLGLLVRGDLDWIVMKAIDKNRTRRYETANGLAMEIRRHLAGDAVSAAPPGAGYRMRKFIRRNRVMVSAGAAVAGALLIGVAAFAWQAKVARDQRDIAVKAQASEAAQRKTAEEQRMAARIAADAAERAAYQAQMVSAAHAVEGQRIDAARALLSATSPRLRGWEYRHLESRLDRTLPSPFPANWLITACLASPDGRMVAVQRSMGDGPKEWVVLAGDLRSPRLTVPDTDIYSFTFSPDGTRALWAPPIPKHEGPAVLWDIESAKVIATLPIEFNPGPQWSLVVTWCASSDGGGDRVMISHPGGYQVHDGHTGARLHHASTEGYMYFTGVDRWMVFLANRYAPANDAGQLRLIDSRTFEPSGDFYRFNSPVSQIMFWRSRIVCALEDGTLRLLAVEGDTLHELKQIVAGISNFNTSTVFSHDGRMITAGSMVSGRVRAWETESGALVGDFGGPQSGVGSQWFLPDSSGLWACDMNGHHHVWPLNQAPPGVLTAHKSYVYPAVASADGRVLVTGGWDGLVGQGGGIKVWDPRTGDLVAEYGQPGEVFRSVGLTSDGRYLVAGLTTADEANHRTEVREVATGALVTTFKPPSTYSVCTIVHPDGRRVISTYGRGHAYVWNLLTGEMIWQTDQRQEITARVPSAAAAISPDGRTLAFTDRQFGLRLVNAESFDDIRRWDAHADGIWSLAFSPDGKWLLSASEDQTLGVWDVASGSLIARLTGHGAQVMCAAMSPDGTRIASGGRDGIVRLWDTTHFENVAQLAGHTDYIFCLTWSPDGQQLISTSGDATVRIWDTRTLAQLLAARQKH